MANCNYRYDFKAELIYHLKRGPVLASIYSLHGLYPPGRLLNELSQVTGKDIKFASRPDHKAKLYW